MNNVVADHPDVVARLKAVHEQFVKEMDDGE
jgi:hypothetical protein